MPDVPETASRSAIADETLVAIAKGTIDSKPTGLGGEAHDLKAIRAAVIDAASVSAALWVSYLFVLFYLLVAAGAVTHKDLLLESPVKLPFLSVDLPLRGFFWLGPAIFLVVHVYVLLHFGMLSGKVRAFDRQLREQVDPDQEHSDTRAWLRRQLPSNIFVQFLAGPPEVRRGLIGWLLRLTAWISLVIGPVALLVFFQLQFYCRHCDHSAPLDLAGMAEAGHADTPLLELPLRCERCGATAY